MSKTNGTWRKIFVSGGVVHVTTFRSILDKNASHDIIVRDKDTQKIITTIKINVVDKQKKEILALDTPFASQKNEK